MFPAFSYAQLAVPSIKETILDEKIGDLDKDGIEEKVVVASYLDSSGIKMKRELRILKKKNWDWIVWIISEKAILPFKEGGIMGDPFEYVEIADGILYVRQSGGNTWKWGQTDRYKYKNGNFELINYSSIYGKPCEYWADFSYNLEKDKIAYRKVFEKCAFKKSRLEVEHENFRHILKKKITIENRYDEYTTIMCPKLKQEISF